MCSREHRDALFDGLRDPSSKGVVEVVARYEEFFRRNRPHESESLTAECFVNSPPPISPILNFLVGVRDVLTIAAEKNNHLQRRFKLDVVAPG